MNIHCATPKIFEESYYYATRSDTQSRLDSPLNVIYSFLQAIMSGGRLSAEFGRTWRFHSSCNQMSTNIIEREVDREVKSPLM